MSIFVHTDNNSELKWVCQDYMNGFEHRTFISRLLFILGERDRYPWGEALGLTRGTINRISSGHVPGPEILGSVTRSENVSLSWLLEGIGVPYLVSRCQSDAEACALLTQHLNDEPGWAIYLIACEPDFVIVLTNPCQIVSGSKTVDYSCVEIISGAGPETVRAALDARKSNPVRRLSISSKDLQRLSAGWMGNLELFGWRDTPGILAQAKPIVDYPPDLAPGRVAEPRAVDGIPDDERELLDLYRELPESKKKAVLTLLKK